MFALEPHAVVVRAVAVVSTIDDAKLGEGMSTQIDVLITRLSETPFRELFDCSPKKTLVDLASGEIPRIPTHRWKRPKAIVQSERKVSNQRENCCAQHSASHAPCLSPVIPKDQGPRKIF
eukprot:m.174236 g.174236  ORF g.174236 m.174236 type:complete len:120 (+) comp14869_c0_seq4:1317-1676(+)